VSGHVFHPGHDELHGVTVVVSGASGKTYVGRWHQRDDRGVLLQDVATHDPSSSPVDRDAWLAKQRNFGVAATEKYVILATDEVTSVSRLDGPH
jgi:hypothetical protein